MEEKVKSPADKFTHVGLGPVVTEKARGPFRASDFGCPAKYDEEAQLFADYLVAQERERCAKVCDEYARQYEEMLHTEELRHHRRWEAIADGAKNCAAAIRKG